MKNKVVFENGIEHEFTKDELKLLRMALENFNWADVLCSEVREAELRQSMNNLVSLFCEHLD